MKCFDKRSRHVGELQTLIRIDTDPDLEAVVRWCPECGAVVVDKEHDNRMFGNYVGMKFSKLTRRTLKHNVKKN